MHSWLDFEGRFREIANQLKWLRLDFQWGATGEYWRLAGTGYESRVRQFEGLATLAGQLLERCFDSSTRTGQLILLETSSIERWYRAIKKLSGEFNHKFSAIQKDEDGNDAGYIYSGSIENVVEVSANVCLKLHALYPLDKINMKTPSINISHSTIGIFNTGELKNIEAIKLNVSMLETTGLDSVADALRELTQAVTTSTEISEDRRSEVLEQLEELSKLATEKNGNKVKPFSLASRRH